MIFSLKPAVHFTFVTYEILNTQVFITLFIVFVAVSIGFEMAQYSIEEGQTPPLTVRIVRKNNLTAIQDYCSSVELLWRSDSTATKGISI